MINPVPVVLSVIGISLFVSSAFFVLRGDSASPRISVEDLMSTSTPAALLEVY